MARIGIDVDGVLRDFPRAVVARFKKAAPNVVTSDVVTGWRFPNIALSWKTKAGLIFGKWAEEIYGGAEPMPGACEEFHRLKQWAKRNGHELVCVTNNIGRLGVYTREWLDKHGFTFDEYHFRGDKENVPIDYLVDDSPEVFEAWVRAKGDDSRFILFDHPYNREVPARWRMSNLMTVTGIVEGRVISYSANPLTGVPAGFLEFTDSEGTRRLKTISLFEFYCGPDYPGEWRKREDPLTQSFQQVHQRYPFAKLRRSGKERRDISEGRRIYDGGAHADHLGGLRVDRRDGRDRRGA